MDRLDGLGRDDAARLTGLTGRSLDLDEDAELQACVAEAAALTQAPIAAVSLVLRRSQLFRAQVGMPPDLAAAGATDRDVSFCQVVVRDRAPLTVRDAAVDARVPQDLVARYGVRAYLGVPIEVGGQPVGSLCAIDTTPRDFSAGDIAGLRAIADRVERRLEALRHEPPAVSAVAAAPLRAVFGEIRNLLLPLETNLAVARVAMAEVAALGRLVDYVRRHGAVPATGSLASTAFAIGDLQGALDDAASAAAELRVAVLAIETATIAGDRTRATTLLIQAALTLAHHDTKLVGGVRVPPGATATMAAPTVDVVNLIAAALCLIASQLRAHGDGDGIDVAVAPSDDVVAVTVTAPTLAAARHELAAADVAALTATLPTGSPLSVAPTAGGLMIRAPRA